MTTLRLGVLSWPVGRPGSIAAFADRLAGWLDQARGSADLCLLPEYACMELGAALAAADPPDAAAELAAMLAVSAEVLAVLRRAAMQAGVWLVPGTLPMRAASGAILNRAPFIAPDGRLAFQDKQAMTRFESECWGMATGAPPAVFDTPWGRLGLSVCYDVEFPKHARAQVEAGAWLVLVPACADSPHGFSRVRIGAAARALENQCFVAVAPTVCAAPWSATLDANHGQALVLAPPDLGFPADGVVAAGIADAPGWLFVTLDPGEVASVREHGAVRNHRDWPRKPVARPRPAAWH